MAKPHICDEQCVCPKTGKRYYYGPSTDQHACQDPDCTCLDLSVRTLVYEEYQKQWLDYNREFNRKLLYGEWTGFNPYDHDWGEVLRQAGVVSTASLIPFWVRLPSCRPVGAVPRYKSSFTVLTALGEISAIDYETSVYWQKHEPRDDVTSLIVEMYGIPMEMLGTPTYYTNAEIEAKWWQRYMTDTYAEAMFLTRPAARILPKLTGF